MPRTRRMARRAKCKLIRSGYQANRRRFKCVRARRQVPALWPHFTTPPILFCIDIDLGESILTIQIAPPPPINFKDAQGNEYYYNYLVQPNRPINFEEGMSSAKLPLQKPCKSSQFSHHVYRFYNSSTHPRTRSVRQNG